MPSPLGRQIELADCHSSRDFREFQERRMPMQYFTRSLNSPYLTVVMLFIGFAAVRQHVLWTYQNALDIPGSRLR